MALCDTVSAWLPMGKSVRGGTNSAGRIPRALRSPIQYARSLAPRLVSPLAWPSLCNVRVTHSTVYTLLHKNAG